IATVLDEHLAVRESLVLVRADEGGDNSLVAYLLSAADTHPADNALRDFLRERLPAYMVPAHFVWLAAWPLTPNGKIDRRALPAPAAGATAVHTAPRTPLEEALVAMWASVLGYSAIGVDENFFELGG